MTIDFELQLIPCFAVQPAIFNFLVKSFKIHSLMILAMKRMKLAIQFKQNDQLVRLQEHKNCSSTNHNFENKFIEFWPKWKKWTLKSLSLNQCSCSSLLINQIGISKKFNIDYLTWTFETKLETNSINDKVQFSGISFIFFLLYEEGMKFLLIELIWKTGNSMLSI